MQDFMLNDDFLPKLCQKHNIMLDLVILVVDQIARAVVSQLQEIGLNIETALPGVGQRSGKL